VRTSYLPSEIRWGECLVPLMTYHKNDGRYCIDFSQFDNTRPLDEMPSCSAKQWSDECFNTTVDQSDHSTSFNSTIVRSISFTSGFPVVGKRKWRRKVGTAAPPQSKSATCSCGVRTRSVSCTDVVPQFLEPTPPPMMSHSSTAPVLHHQHESTRSLTGDDVDFGISWSTARNWSKEDGSPPGRVYFQLEDVVEDDSQNDS